MLENVPVSFFDDKFAVMQSGHEEKGGEWQFAYAQQIALLEARLANGGVILDAGCGPALPYTKPAGAFVIGLEYSLPSVAANRQVDLRVCASAAALPLANASIDTIVCFYSIHHMIGGTVKETETLIAQILSEFARVIKPGGEVLIFEMAPVGPFGSFERLVWPLAKRLLGSKLDMFFWPVPALCRLAVSTAPQAILKTVSFKSSAWTTFPPIFSLPWFRIPRFLYPLKPVVYSWKF
jgi:SAM-dependent methyltransferase